MADNVVKPITNTRFEPVKDGSIPIDSSGISKNQYDALNPVGDAGIQFETGNYGEGLLTLKNSILTAEQTIQKTLIPLIEVALIELMGSSNSYQRKHAQLVPAMTSGYNVTVNFKFVYSVPLWIGTDIEPEAIQHDSTYIMNRIGVITNAKIGKCEIDCSDGTLTIVGAITTMPSNNANQRNENNMQKNGESVAG